MEQNDKIDLFISYYRSTWLSESSLFPPKIWNHFDTVGPRTNNHVEGFNFKLNTYSFCKHPNVYVLINLLKEMESTISRNHIKFYIRPIDQNAMRFLRI